jgi:hypothetical protein
MATPGITRMFETLKSFSEDLKLLPHERNELKRQWVAADPMTEKGAMRTMLEVRRRTGSDIELRATVDGASTIINDMDDEAQATKFMNDVYDAFDEAENGSSGGTGQCTVLTRIPGTDGKWHTIKDCID